MEERKIKSNAVVQVTKQDGKLHFNVIGAGKLVFDPDKVSATNRARAMMQGFITRISNGAAMERSTETGASATPEDKLERMRAIAEHLESGSDEWSTKVRAVGGVDGGLVVRAMIHCGLARDVEGVETILAATVTSGAAKDRAGAQKLWGGTDKVVAAIAELKAAAPTIIDADALMARILAAGAQVDEEGEEDEGA